jgi:hypothetical protein
VEDDIDAFRFQFLHAELSALPLVVRVRDDSHQHGELEFEE